MAPGSGTGASLKVPSRSILFTPAPTVADRNRFMAYGDDNEGISVKSIKFVLPAGAEITSLPLPTTVPAGAVVAAFVVSINALYDTPAEFPGVLPPK